MAGLPPIPPGFVLDEPAPRRRSRPADPYKLLKDEGFTFTNGFRTNADTARIRAQGYKPAKNSLHLTGDGVDVDHPSLSPAQQKARLDGLFGGWKGARVIDEKHHRHVQLPGWGEAPGTPGTKNSGLPPIPPGFELQQRGALTGGNFVEAPPALSEKDARVATIRQNGFAPDREAELVRTVEAEYGFTFSPEQSEALRQYVPKAASPDDLDAFARQLSGGRAGLTNAAQVFHDFAKTGTLPPGVVRAKSVPAGTPATPGLAERLVAPVNEGIADVLGAPVDLMTAGLNAFGAGIERPFLGSDMIRDNMRSLGFGQTSEAYAPQSRLEGYGQALTRGVGQAVLPTVGLPAAGAGLAMRTASAVTRASPVRSAARQLLVETAKRPGIAAVAEIAGGAGSGVGAQTAREVAPGNALAEVAGAVIGGVGAGGLAAIGAVRRGVRPAPVVRDGVEVGPFGPVHADLADDYPAALARMRADGAGEVPGAIKHPDIGEVDLIWGNDDYGLAKIVAKHPEVVDDLPAIVERLPIKETPADNGNGRYVLEDDVHRAVVSPDFDGDPKRWLVTAFEKKGAPGGQTSRRDPLLPDGGSTGVGAGADIRLSGQASNDLPSIPAGYVLDESSMAMAADDALPTVTGPARMVDRIDLSSLPPIPDGFVLDEGTAALGGSLGRARPMGDRLPAEDIADLARGVNPEDVTPIPGNTVESPDEVPGSFVPIEGPGSLGRAPKKPEGFATYLRRTLAADSQAKGMPVRLDAEDAIDKGVPAELIYRNPTVADKAKLQLRNPSLFGTRYGRMTAAQQDLRTLDMDSVDPAQWGYDGKAGQRLDPEDIGDLLRRDLEGDDTALERGAGFDAWSGYQARAADKAEFEGRYGDDLPVEQRGEPVTGDDLAAINLPESAYDDTPRASGTIGNINLDRLENPGDVSRLIRQVQDRVGGFDEASRGVVTNAETRALADELGLTPEQLLKRRRGQALNAEELYATRVLVQKSREVVANLAKAAQGGTDEQLAAFRNAWIRHVALEEHATAATAEVGRAMQSFKMLARAGDGITTAVNTWPVAKLIIPFIRTPINLLKFAGERSVFAPGLKEFRDAWKAGGNARNEAVARMTMGTGLSALAVSYALDGKLSGGGPTNPRERSALTNSGWQPYSMKIGDRWVSYQRFDPISMLIGAAADFAEIGANATERERSEITTGLVTAVAKNITSKTWLSGLSDMFEVLSDPERYGQNWAERMAGSLAVPALGAHLASAVDPNLREVNGYLDAVKNRVPGLSHDLLARRNVWGDEIKRGNGAGGSALSSAYSFVSPVSSSRIKPSPLLREVARLRAPLSMPQRRVRVGGVDRPLTPEQYAYYVQLAGKPAKAHLEEYVGTSEWRALTDDERRDYLADTLKETRADAREQLLTMFPKLAAEPDLPPIPAGYQLPPIPPGFQLAR